MTYERFEGEKKVNTVRREQDKLFFKKVMKELGFKWEIDLVTFCVALALRKEYEEHGIDKKPLNSFKKLVGMESFERSEFYDLIILDYLNVKTKRLAEFETYFYTGFVILKEWFDDNGLDVTSELERFSGIWDYVTSTNNQDE